MSPSTTMRRYVVLDIPYWLALRLAVIKSFGDKRTAAIFAGYAVRDLPPPIQRRARAKLLMLDAAKQVDDLRVPPGNRLEALRGNRKGQISIRINNQWRICFRWRDGEAWDVTIVDYH
jgi:proteic killer suppression protein